MTDGNGRVAEQWVYAGIREGKGKRYHAWVDPQGEEHWYGEKGSFAIGYLYDVKVDRTSDALSRTKPVYAGRSDVSDEQRQEWAALDRAAQTRLATIARERNAARQDALAELVDPLVELARRMPMASDRDALAAYVLRRIASAR